MNLSDNERNEVLELIKQGKKLPKEYIYKLYQDDEDVFLFWNGRTESVTNAVLPFHSIEHIDEPRKEAKAMDSLFATDDRGRQLKGWTNKLIWGDNKLILSSLINGALKKEIEAEGGLKLVYIDPPFAVGADFSHNVLIQGEEINKKQSIIEEIAYRDTWGRGISSYLSMMYERLNLIHNLISEDGSIFVHCDYRINSHVRIILNDIFGIANYVNEIVWKRQTAHSDYKQGAKHFGRIHDTIFFYAKNINQLKIYPVFSSYSKEYIESNFKNIDENGERYSLGDITGPGGASKGNPYYEFLGVKRYWAFSKENIEQMYQNGEIIQTNPGTVPRRKRYLKDMPGISVQSFWDDIPSVQSQSFEKLDYPTQKPEKLLERIVNSCSKQGDLIADFFCGSGTTASVSEKLGRKWITCDLGRYAVHTTRKRLIQVQRVLKNENKTYRAFEVLNLGKYERQFFFGVPANLTEAEQTALLEQKQEKYIDLILEGYSAQRVSGFKMLHAKKAGRYVHVGPLSVPVTRTLIEEIFEECRTNLITQVDVLGFEFEMNLTGMNTFIKETILSKGVDVRLRYIPKEVFDKRAVDKGQLKFYDVAYLQAKPKVNKKEVTIELTNFTSNYTQDDLEDLEQSLKKGSSKVIIENGQIIKLTKDQHGIMQRESVTKNWIDWIDYWSVDFDYESKKEIIKIGTSDEQKEVWTGNYIFENEWQSFRTKKNPELELKSVPHEYAKPGRYKIMVKVVDILGVDTSQVVEVEIK